MIDIVAECSGAKTIGICGHIKPDGDCIGATLALSLYLKKRLPESDITVFSDEIAPCFDCVEGIKQFNYAFDNSIPIKHEYKVIDKRKSYGHGRYSSNIR